MRHAVQPARERILHPERSRLFGQHEEGGLEGILGGVLVAEHAPADAEDHRPVPLHQGLEGELGAVLGPVGEPRQELGIRQPGEGAQVPQPMNLTEQSGASARHVRSLPPGDSSCLPVMPGSGVRLTDFLETLRDRARRTVCEPGSLYRLMLYSELVLGRVGLPKVPIVGAGSGGWFAARVV